jgi:hypothetical protein
LNLKLLVLAEGIRLPPNPAGYRLPTVVLQKFGLLLQ